MIVRSECPSCKSDRISSALNAIDHTVSGEEFAIWECAACSLKFTQAVPGREQIARYYSSQDYISHSDTSKGIVNALYHRVRKITLASKKALIEKYTGLTRGRILDVGAGTGAFLKTMQDGSWEGTGIESDALARAKAKELYGLDMQNAENLFSTIPQTFDAVTMWHVLEHVHDLHEYIEQLKKVMKSNGWLFIAVPNYTSFDEHIYKNFWAAYDVPRHLYHFSPRAMKGLLIQHKLQLKHIKPMYFDSFYVSMLSEKYKYGKSNFIKACLNGLVSNLKALQQPERCSSLIYLVKKSE